MGVAVPVSSPMRSGAHVDRYDMAPVMLVDVGSLVGNAVCSHEQDSIIQIDHRVSCCCDP